jgi:D-3-phosphoglycerate dehydrogenase
MKIICPDPKTFSIECIKEIKEIKQISATYLKDISQKRFDKIGKNYDIILTRFTRYIGKNILSKDTKVRYILTPTTNPEDYIDITQAKKKNIKIFSLIGENKFLNKISATAEHTWLLILALSRNLISASDSVSSLNWSPIKYKGIELQNKTIGIVGFGRLGKKVANYAKSFGMNVIFFDKNVTSSKKYKKINSLSSLILKSDIVSIHSTLNKETYHMFNNKTLSKFKKNTLLINTSRGEIIDSRSLVSFLKKKKIKGAALDLIENEVLLEKRKNNPLIKYSRKNKNIIITPHLGGYTEESVKKTDLFILKKFTEYIKLRN